MADLNITSWNCQMALRKKAKAVLALSPDILIVPESEHPEKINFQGVEYNSVWIGDNPNKGLAVYGFNGVSLELESSYTDQFRHIAPINVTFNGFEFSILAVWTMPCSEPREQRYIGQVYYSIDHYKGFIDQKTLIVGDFNWNLGFDTGKKKANFSSVLDTFSKMGIESAYHRQNNEAFGRESQNTFFMYRKEEKQYHIDYCFHGSYWASRLQSVEIGQYDGWKEYSDHAPLVVRYE